MSGQIGSLRASLAPLPTAVSPQSPATSPAASKSFAARLHAKFRPPSGLESAPEPAAKGVGLDAHSPLLAEARRFAAAIARDHSAIHQGISTATSGATLPAGELLALQVRVYGFGQKVDLAAKVVEKSVGTVRRVVDLQV